MKRLLAAFEFLTVAPVPSTVMSDMASLSGALPFFPVVGLAIGVVLAVLDAALGSVLPVWPASALTVAAMAAVSGGLHIDGLSDTADAMLSSKPRERKLEIMKDSAAGPMGVVTLVFVVVLKITSLASITHNVRWAAVMLAPVAGRCAMTIAVSLFPYVRQNGLGAVFNEGKKPVYAIWGTLFLAAVGVAAAEGMGLAICGASLTAALALAFFIHVKIGGMTGDTYGAVCEAAETVSLITAAAWVYGGVA